MLLNIEIPLHFDLPLDYNDAAGVDCDQSAADVGICTIPFKCEVVRAQVTVTEVCAGSSTTPVVDFDLRPTAGSDASRGAADLGHLVLSTTAAGKTMYDLVGAGELLEPGMEVVCQLTTAASGGSPTGHFYPVLIVKPVPEELANLTDMVETA